MIGQLVAWALKNRLIVALGVLALIAVGVRSYLTLPVDAVPDITNVQVQVLTNAPGLAPLEVESLVCSSPRCFVLAFQLLDAPLQLRQRQVAAIENTLLECAIDEFRVLKRPAAKNALKEAGAMQHGIVALSAREGLTFVLAVQR